MGYRALDAALACVRSRLAFDQRLADFEDVQFKLAEAATELAAARLMSTLLRGAPMKPH